MKQYTLKLEYKDSYLNDVDLFLQKNIFFTINDKEVDYKKGQLSSIDFFDKESGEKIWKYEDFEVTLNIPININKNECINYTFIDEYKILSTKYSSLDYGIYLVMLYDIDSKVIEHEILTRHKNITTMGACFGSEVERRKKIIAYVKLQDFKAGE